MTASSLTELRPPPAFHPFRLQASKRPSTAGYWSLTAVVAVLQADRRLPLGALGISNTPRAHQRPTAWPFPSMRQCRWLLGTMVIYHERGRGWPRRPDGQQPFVTSGTKNRTIVTVSYPSDAPTWQQLGLT